ncbi:MAG: cytochrome c4 [Proteobacteria bacterium]|nr:cytochrome c4 [Pseudomonadota bacterium]
MVAITVCGTCHGRTGNSTQPKFPRLAGQSANYLAAQLKAFRAQTRGDPDAISYMWGMASELDDSTIAALADYYSAQKAEPSSNALSLQGGTGKQIYEQGIAAEGVPACSSCHGSDAHGVGDFPRLAGQHSQYVLKQLASFQSNMRNVAVMHGVALNLRSPEMSAIAAYLEAQP